MKKLLGIAVGLALLCGSASYAQDYQHHDDQQPGWSRAGDHHDWDRGTFDREWGSRGADWDHQWRRGDQLPDGYARDQRYIVSDYRHHHLSRARYGYHWVRYGDGYIQARDDGYIGRTVYNSRY